MSSTSFVSEVYEVADAIEANELYQRNGWTEGLPIVPPTEASVERLLARFKRSIAACGTEINARIGHKGPMASDSDLRPASKCDHSDYRKHQGPSRWFR